MGLNESKGNIFGGELMAKEELVNYSYKKELTTLLKKPTVDLRALNKVRNRIISELCKPALQSEENFKDFYKLNYDLVLLLRKQFSRSLYIGNNIVVSQEYFSLADHLQRYYFGILENCFGKMDVSAILDELTTLQSGILPKYDESCFYLLQSNDWYGARNYYYVFGENLLKRAYFLEHFNKSESDFDLARTYYQAGRAFLRSEEILKDKFIYTTIAPPHLPGFVSSDLFKLGNTSTSAVRLAELCFERAKAEYTKKRDKEMILKSKEFLFQIAIKLNFGKQLFEKTIEISRHLLYKKNYFFNLPKVKLDEAAFRDYFLADLNLLLSANSVAENPKRKGRTDITVNFRDNKGNIQEGIIEFKIWGKGNYKKVTSQVRKYFSDYDSFAIIVLINKTKKDISQAYAGLIKKDASYIKDTLDVRLFDKENLVNIESSHLDNGKRIKLYHIILNVGGYL